MQTCSGSVTWIVSNALEKKMYFEKRSAKAAFILAHYKIPRNNQNKLQNKLQGISDSNMVMKEKVLWLS